jgi:hypothetical protein
MPTPDLSPKKLREHFADLTAKSLKLEAKLEPLRAELDAVVAGEGDITVVEARKREGALRPKIRDLQEQLAPIEMQRAAVARALGGKTSEPAEG